MMNSGAKSILPLPTRAIGTLQDMGGTMRISPLCHEGHHHEINGWVLELPGTGHASTIPVPHNLFHGVSVALCDISEEEILGLMKDGDGTRARLGDAVNTLLQDSKDDASRASWKRCRPQTTTLHSAHRDKDGVITFAPAGPAVIDGAPWACELSPDGFVGIYFRWQSATVQMYAVCQSYLPKACLEFSTLVHRAVDDPECTAEIVCLSEEAQWLRAACERNRARKIAGVCKSLGISVPVFRDYRAFFGADDLAVVTTDTLHHEMTAQNGIVRVFNYCADTSTAHNGSICTMAPWDGVWAFCGPSLRQGSFGMLHGKKGVVLPTAAPRVKQREPHHLSFTSFNTRQCKPLQIWHRGSSGTKAIVLPPIAHKHRELAKGDDPLMVEAYNRALQQYAVPMTIPVKRALDGQAQDIYLDFDEHVLEQMARLGWNRSHGNAKLVPLACALYDHWLSQ
jgi:hypothetical protein